jgi:hypothetical protein
VEEPDKQQREYASHGEQVPKKVQRNQKIQRLKTRAEFKANTVWGKSGQVHTKVRPLSSSFPISRQRKGHPRCSEALVVSLYR